MTKKQYKEQGIAFLGIVAALAAILLSGFTVGALYSRQKNQLASISPSPTPTQTPRLFTIQVTDEEQVPLADATLTFTTHIFCAQMVGLDCPQPTPIVLKADRGGKVSFPDRFPGDTVTVKADGFEEKEVELLQFSRESETLSVNDQRIISLKKK